MKREVLGNTKVCRETIEEPFVNCATHKIQDKEEVINESVDKKKKEVKCRHNDRGYCSQSWCVFLHSDII